MCVSFIMTQITQSQAQQYMRERVCRSAVGRGSQHQFSPVCMCDSGGSGLETGESRIVIFSLISIAVEEHLDPFITTCQFL